MLGWRRYWALMLIFSLVAGGIPLRAQDKRLDYDDSSLSPFKSIQGCLEHGGPGCWIFGLTMVSAVLGSRALVLATHPSQNLYEQKVRDDQLANFRATKRELKLRLLREAPDSAQRLNEADARVEHLKSELIAMGKQSEIDPRILYAKARETEMAAMELYVLTDAFSRTPTPSHDIRPFAHQIARELEALASGTERFQGLIGELTAKERVNEIASSMGINLPRPNLKGILRVEEVWHRTGSELPLVEWLKSDVGQGFLASPEGSAWFDKLKTLMKEMDPHRKSVQDLVSTVANRENPHRREGNGFYEVIPSIPSRIHDAEIFHPERFFRVGEDFDVNPIGHNAEISHHVQEMCDWGAERLGKEVIKHRKVLRSPRWWFSAPKLGIAGVAAGLAGFGISKYYEGAREQYMVKQKTANEAKVSLMGQFEAEHKRGAEDRLLPYLDSGVRHLISHSENDSGPSLADQMTTTLEQRIPIRYLGDATVRESMLTNLQNAKIKWSHSATVRAELENALRDHGEHENVKELSLIKSYLFAEEGTVLAETGETFLRDAFGLFVKKMYGGAIDDGLRDMLVNKYYTHYIGAVRADLRKSMGKSQGGDLKSEQPSVLPAGAGQTVNGVPTVTQADTPNSLKIFPAK
jgi:hypothetical protein